MSEPLWCEIRGHYCRCQDFGKRCQDNLDREQRELEPLGKFFQQMGDTHSAAPSVPSEEKK